MTKSTKAITNNTHAICEAIAATRINGVKTNLGFHGAALDDAEFQTGGVDTGFVDRLYARRPDLCDRHEAGASHG